MAEFLYSQNFILKALEEKYSLAPKVSLYHLNALTANQADPDINAMRILFAPVHTVLTNASSEKSTDIGQRIGFTGTLNSLFENLISTHLPAWQQEMRNTYAANTNEYKAFFPFGNKPFTDGRIEDKLNAVKALRDQCTADAAAAIQAVGVTVGAYYTLLLNARNAQLGKKVEVGGDRDAQQNAIKAMCVLHFSNWGKLIGKFPENQTLLNSFIDVQTLQRIAHSSLYEGTANPLQIKKVCTHRFAPVSTIVVTNDGTTDFKLWLAESAKSTVHPAGVTVPAGTVNMVIQVVNLGNPTHRVLMLQNLDPAADASYEIYVGTKNSDPLTDPHD
jgi:hypothetical protein